MRNLLATRFAKRSPQINSRTPLDDDALRAVVPSLFADKAHDNRALWTLAEGMQAIKQAA